MIHVCYFAGAAEAAGCDSADVTTSAPTVGALVAELGARDDRFARVLSVCTFLLEGKAAEASAPLPDGSHLDVLPPFAGG